ncbi:MAG: oligosaccharide flippase family protein, partial [Promethearchaeota archaeon]
MKEKVVTRIVFRLTITFLSLIIGYLFLLKFEVKAIGIIAFSTSLVGVFSLFSDLGFSLIYIQHNSDEDFEDYFSIYYLLQIIILLANFGPLFIFIFFLDLEPLVLNFLILKIISEFIINLAFPWIINLESRLKYMKLELVVIIINILRDILILHLLFNIENFQYPLYILGQIYIITALIQMALVLIISKGEFRFRKIKKDKLRQFLKDSKPLIKLRIISALVGNIGYILIDLSYGHEALAYYYFIDNYVITILLIVSAQIHQIILTRFPKEFQEGNLKNIEFFIHKIEKFSSILHLAIAIIAILNGHLLIGLFLPKYSESVVYLYILIFIPYLAGINRPYSALFIPAKKQRLSSNYNLTKAIVFTILIIIFVPKEFFSIKMLGLGGLGLAILAILNRFIDIFSFRYFDKKLGISYNPKIVIHFILALISLLIVFVLCELFIKDII